MSDPGRPSSPKRQRVSGPGDNNDDVTMAADESKSNASSWVKYGPECEFPIQNIPFGVFRPTADATPRIGTAIGDQVVDLSALAKAGLFDASFSGFLAESSLNSFMGAGKTVWRAARSRIIELLSAGNAELRDNAELRSAAMFAQSEVVYELPCAIGDYTDFYSSREHATNVGTMFRGKDNALQPNWLHLPVGYHGRASSIVITGTDVKRPCGQLQKNATNPKEGSTYGPCRLLDFELEVGTFVGKGNALGEPITIDNAEDHIFGLVLLNDWSARDIQKWEYVPLGPFGAKNFASTISPWIVTLDALAPFKCATSAGAQTDPKPLPYLQDPDYRSYDINLKVELKNDSVTKPFTLSESNFRYLYWNVKQQLVHHTVTGCNMRPGDLLGSGTISGPERANFGSMLEISWKGSMPVTLPDGSQRKFLADGDTVVMRGYCQGDGYRVGFGEAAGKVLPATPYTPKK